MVYPILKRLFDFSFALLLLTLVMPLLIVVYLILRIKYSTNPIFFQKRLRKSNMSFEIMKFKTMTDSRDANGELKPDKDRITKFGLFLRSSSLDELPQLINILKGEMSFVGPRPLLPEYLPLYSDHQLRRHHVTPGITGWAQVNGRNAISWEQKFDFDVWYVDNRSFWLDAKILILTVLKVLGRSDIASKSSVSMEKFKGNQL